MKADVTGPDDAPMSPDAVRRMLRDLREHQADLALREEAVRREQDRLNAMRSHLLDLYDVAPAGFVTLSEAGLIQQANFAAVTLLGLERGAPCDQPISRFLAAEDLAAFRLFSRRLVETCEKQSAEFVMVKVDGTRFRAQLVAAVVHNESATPELLVVLSDVTARSQAEDALRASEDRSRAILHTAMDGFWLADMQGRLLEVNEAYCRMSGYDAQELRAMRITDLEDIETTADTAERLQRIVARGEDRFESRHRRKDGSIFVVDVSVQYRAADGGQLVVFLRDITVRKQADLVLEEMQAHVGQAQKFEAIGLLAGGIAHDFRNVLTAILGNADLAYARIAEDHPARVNIERMRSAGGRASRLVDQILTMSHRQEFARIASSLAPVVEEARSLLVATLPANVELTATCDPSTPTVLADSSQMHQVVLNLVTNAWQSLGGERGNVTIELAPVTLTETLLSLPTKLPPGSYARLSVRDNGCGMSPDVLARLFEPFFTTKPGTGTGLGLPVALGIVKGHDGAVVVDSTPGQGTTVHVYLPAFDGPTRERRPVMSSPASSRGEGLHVLFVDDEEMVVDVVRGLLEPLGYAVTGCLRGEEALDAVRANPGGFNVLVTDLQMPGMSGLQLARAVARLRADLPVVLVSGHLSASDVADAHAAGIAEIIPKPEMLRLLEGVVCRLCSRPST